MQHCRCESLQPKLRRSEEKPATKHTFLGRGQRGGGCSEIGSVGPLASHWRSRETVCNRSCQPSEHKFSGDSGGSGGSGGSSGLATKRHKKINQEQGQRRPPQARGEGPVGMHTMHGGGGLSTLSGAVLPAPSALLVGAAMDYVSDNGAAAATVALHNLRPRTDNIW